MELKELSSNWRALQKTLQKPKESESKKRKAEKALPNGSSHPAKRRRDSAGKGLGPLQGDMGQGIARATTLVSKAAAWKSMALWAKENDIPAGDLALAYGSAGKVTVEDGAGKDKINEGLSPTAEVGKYLALDCEMVGVGGDEDERSVLARASLVNYHGVQIYDSFVRPKETVTDWRTAISGVAPRHMATARTFETVQKDVAQLLQGRILIGHAIRNDLEALLLRHPKRDIRDTSRHFHFRQLSAGRTPALKKLAKEVLGLEIQGGEHSSIEDARVCMLLYRQYKDKFETEHAQRWPNRTPRLKVKGSGVKTKRKKKGKK